ncbi:hypothetical protein V2J09_000452 [Rumex salicifolius]
MGCKPSKSRRRRSASVGNLESAILASQTSFTMNEVEALYILYKQMSSSVVDDDDIINKDDFQLALLGSSKKKNLFLDRVFALFDVNQNGVIEFGDFVRSMSIFHPRASQTVKIQFAFNLYDIRHTGYIQRDELKEMVLAILEELDVVLSDESVEALLDKTFMDVDSKGDGKIDRQEWEDKQLRIHRPTIVPYPNRTVKVFLTVQELCITFPSFMMSSQVEDSDLSGRDNRFNCHRVVPSNSNSNSNNTYSRDAAKQLFFNPSILNHNPNVNITLP